MSHECRACKASIEWIEMRSGKRMPVDAEPEPRVFLVVENGEQVGEIRPSYMPHWATCPSADQFRKGG